MNSFGRILKSSSLRNTTPSLFNSQLTKSFEFQKKSTRNISSFASQIFKQSGVQFIDKDDNAKISVETLQDNKTLVDITSKDEVNIINPWAKFELWLFSFIFPFLNEGDVKMGSKDASMGIWKALITGNIRKYRRNISQQVYHTLSNKGHVLASDFRDGDIDVYFNVDECKITSARTFFHWNWNELTWTIDHKINFNFKISWKPLIVDENVKKDSKLPIFYSPTTVYHDVVNCVFESNTYWEDNKRKWNPWVLNAMEFSRNSTKSRWIQSEKESK